MVRQPNLNYMACSNCGNGFFIPIDWNSGTGNNFTSPNGTQVTISSPTSLTVSKGASTLLFNAGAQVHYAHWGANFIAVLTVQGGAIGTRTVSLINTLGASLTSMVIATVGADPPVPLPALSSCPGDGSMVFCKAPDGVSVTNMAISASDTADNLCSAGSIMTTLEIVADATPTQFLIKHGGTTIGSCMRPVADCDVSPNTVNFPDAVIGPGVPASLSVRTAMATITNHGQNCLTINNISSSGPYSAMPATPYPVVLQHNQSLGVTITFAPASIGTYNNDLAITPVPAQGDTVIHCHGLARAPHLTLTYNDPVSFSPPVPLGNTVHQNLTIQNTGEADISVTVPGPMSPASPYQWTGATQVLHPMSPGNTMTVDISFTPMAEGPLPATFNFTSTAMGSPQTVHLQGTGCVPRPQIQIPDMGPVVMGEVQQGFRTVRNFRVRNNGNAVLQFSARIVATMPGDPASEAAADLFGLLQNSSTPVTSPLDSFSQPVNPPSACGVVATGSGNFDFGVTFFANIAPATANARLEIYNHNDPGPGVMPSFFINLTASVINPVSVDVELVLDRSGSMNDASGSRTKIQTTRDAAKLFVQLSRPDVQDRIGLVRFNTIPEVVRSITEITAANQATIANDVNPANFNPDGFTAIAGGVIKAQEDLNAHPRAMVPAALNKVFIVLTDGHDNRAYLNPADSVYYSLLGGDFPDPATSMNVSTVALPVPSDIKIYAIGIGDSIDIGRLSQLSLSTGGAFLQAKEFSGMDFFNLEKHFTQVYMEAVNYAQISDPEFDILPGETHIFEFEVLPGDKSAIVVVYDHISRLPFVVLTPAGESIDLLNVPVDFSIRPGISDTARFLEVNFPQGQPDRYAGTWKVKLTHDHRSCVYRGGTDHGFNTQQFGPGFQPKDCKENNDPIHYGIALGVSSNFGMVAFVTPGIVHTGEPIQLVAMLSEYGLPVKGCTVTVKAVRPDGTETMHTLLDDGVHGDDGNNDGTYGLAYIHTYQQGTYTFTFTATGISRDGKPVKREAVRSKYVEGIQPLIPVTPGRPGSTVNDKCCSIIRTLVLIGLILLLLILISLGIIWSKL